MIKQTFYRIMRFGFPSHPSLHTKRAHGEFRATPPQGTFPESWTKSFIGLKPLSRLYPKLNCGFKGWYFSKKISKSGEHYYFHWVQVASYLNKFPFIFNVIGLCPKSAPALHLTMWQWHYEKNKTKQTYISNILIYLTLKFTSGISLYTLYTTAITHYYQYQYQSEITTTIILHPIAFHLCTVLHTRKPRARNWSISER